MHPDAIIAGLRRELTRLRPEEKERKAAIEAEIKRVDELPRPEIAPELGSFAVADRDRTELTGLRRELARAPKDRHAEIKAEIKRVEALIKAKSGAAESEPEAAEELAETEAQTEEAADAAKSDAAKS